MSFETECLNQILLKAISQIFAGHSEILAPNLRYILMEALRSLGALPGPAILEGAPPPQTPPLPHPPPSLRSWASGGKWVQTPFLDTESSRGKWVPS